MAMGNSTSEFDRKRLERLYEEAAARLFEISLIASRNLGYKSEIVDFRLQRSMTGIDARQGLSAQLAASWPFGNRLYFHTSGGCGYYDFDTNECVGGPCS